MADSEQAQTTDDGVLAGIRGIAGDAAAPPATRLRALELLAKMRGMFRERQGPQYVTIVRRTPPLRLPAESDAPANQPEGREPEEAEEDRDAADDRTDDRPD